MEVAKRTGSSQKVCRAAFSLLLCFQGDEIIQITFTASILDAKNLTEQTGLEQKCV